MQLQFFVGKTAQPLLTAVYSAVGVPGYGEMAVPL